MKYRSTIMTAVALFGFSAGITAVHADETYQASKTVSYAGLDLDSDAGAKIFYTRVQSAAKAVCSGYEGRDLAFATRHDACLDKAIGTAVAQANNSKVTALYSRSKPTSMRLVASR